MHAKLTGFLYLSALLSVSSEEQKLLAKVTFDRNVERKFRLVY